jgi:DNA adenine methylase
MGGKHRQGPKIAEFVKMVLKPRQWYVEPFCGALGAAWRVNHNKMILGDVSEALINMWKTFQDMNFELPDVITEKQYNKIKNIRDPSDWRTAYYGFGASFGGSYFTTFAFRQGNHTNPRALKRLTNLKRNINAKFVCSDYKKLKIPKSSVVYCDPPYENRTKCHDFNTFNTEEFWQWCRNQVKSRDIVLVTSFVVPNDFVVLHNFGDTVTRHYLGKKPDGTQELLVCHKSQKGLFK